MLKLSTRCVRFSPPTSGGVLFRIFSIKTLSQPRATYRLLAPPSLSHSPAHTSFSLPPGQLYSMAIDESDDHQVGLLRDPAKHGKLNPQCTVITVSRTILVPTFWWLHCASSAGSGSSYQKFDSKLTAVLRNLQVSFQKLCYTVILIRLANDSLTIWMVNDQIDNLELIKSKFIKLLRVIFLIRLSPVKNENYYRTVSKSRPGSW